MESTLAVSCTVGRMGFIHGATIAVPSLRQRLVTYFRIVALCVAILNSVSVGAAQPDNSNDKGSRQFDLVFRSEITIDRPVEEVWPCFLNLSAWMLDNRFRNVSGQRDGEGEVRLVTPKGATPYGSYFIKTVRVVPFKQYVLKVVPERSRDYLGFADFSFTEVAGKTHLVYDIYLELTVSGLSDEEFREFARAQYEEAQKVVPQNNWNLKTLVEAEK